MNEKETFTTSDNAEPDLLQRYYSDEELSGIDSLELDSRVEQKLRENQKRAAPLLKYLKALRNYLFDGEVKWYRKSVVVAALLYFIMPLDTIPDFTPFIGFLDDLGVIAWAVRFLGGEIKGYIAD